MIRRILFRHTARRDFFDACEWYNQRRAGLGRRFEAAVEGTLEMISASPESFPMVHRDVRRALVRRFPYGLFYRIRGETIHVLAVLHGRRDPARWKERA
jgi:toxin ParE1/3/4